MGFILDLERGAEADGCDGDGDPGDLIRYADDAEKKTKRVQLSSNLSCYHNGFTYFCSHVQSCPAPIKLAPKQRMLTADVARTAIQGT